MLRLALQRAMGAGPSRPAAVGETSRARSRAACVLGQPGCLARRSCSAPPSSPIQFLPTRPRGSEQVERIVELPPALVKVLDGWGPSFCSKVQAAFAAECDRLSVKCSGLLSGMSLLALTALGRRRRFGLCVHWGPPTCTPSVATLMRKSRHSSRPLVRLQGPSTTC